MGDPISYSDTETGVMVVKDGKAWGVTWDDGRSIAYGWVPMTEGDLHNPDFCKKPTDVTSYDGSPYIQELEGASVVKVKRTLTVEVIE